MPEDRGFAAALVEDGKLQDFILDPPNDTYPPLSGQVWTGKITRKLPGGGGAFCARGALEGYLRQAKGLKSGDTLLVQVVSLPEHGKAPTVTQRVLFKGPRLILTHHAAGINVSRQIRDTDEAQRLKSAVTEAMEDVRDAYGLDEDVGAIVRSAARGEEARHLRAELEGLANQYKVLRSRDNAVGGGTSALDIALTEWLFPMPQQILVSPKLARVLSKPEPPFEAMEFWGDERFLPLLHGEDDPFAAFGLHDEIARLSAPEVPLGGGSMVIEPTRALVAVDVNTGGDFSPAAGLKINLAAARDLPRQLRLRGLGGQIIVDFAAMPKGQRRTLEEALKKAFRDDPIETALVGWTNLGLFELQRKRERRPLTEMHR
ncbi:MAG: ribonuclease G [Rhodobacteraceae bacterium]|nr:ribonuclease E/G [Alphaproteobacteria bacterium]NNK66871.1 ribonuclease G [Paracoccaceae bacterium]